MSNIIDRISDAYDRAKDYVTDHPLQAAAVLAGGPLLGPVIFAGTLAAEEASKKVLPQMTLCEAATMGAGAMVAAGTAMGAMEGVATMVAGPGAAKAIETAAKAAAEALTKKVCEDKH